METEHVQYSVDDLDGVRLIRVAFPRALTPATMPEAFSRYLALWEHDVPTVVLVDMTKLESLPDDGKRALQVLLGRIAIMTNFVASAWLRPRAAAIAADLLDLLSGAGANRIVFEGEADALAFLGERVAARRAGGA